MGKEVFGEYSAFDSGKGIRFQKNNKLVSESAVPKEVVDYLYSKINGGKPKLEDPQVGLEPQVPLAASVHRENHGRFPRPTPEQLAKMREDSLKVGTGLKLTPEEEAQRALSPPAEPAPLNEGDFDVPEPAPRILTDDQLADIGALAEPLDDGIVGEEAARKELESAAIDPEFMERTSIYTADIKDIAQALYDRFGIYSIWLNTTPQTDEINPMTGEAFTRYHQGIAYQSLVRARSSGFFNRPAELAMEAMTEGRVAHENYQREMGDPRQRQFPAEQANAPAPTAESFAYRTSPAAGTPAQTHYISHEPDPQTGEVRAIRREIPIEAQHAGKVNNARQRFDANQDEMIVEPQFGQPVIRPDW